MLTTFGFFHINLNCLFFFAGMITLTELTGSVVAIRMR